MRKLGFWTNSERQQLEAINEASAELGTLKESSHQAQRRLDALHGVIKAQQQDIASLRAALQAVCDVLVDHGLVEEAALEQRIAAAIDDPEPSAMIPAPARPAQPRIKTGMQCARCRGNFSARELTFTDGGPTCARCVASAET